MSIFQLADAPSFEAEVSAIALQRLAAQQQMIADVEALLGKLAAPAPVVEPIEEKAPAPKPRKARKAKPAADVKLNAIGKPYSPQYDPKYRMKYKAPRYAPKPGTSSAASIANIDNMRAHIAQHWAG